jgi:hypothetical protein
VAFLTCPWCGYALLLHFSHGKQKLRCQHCYQEVPLSLANPVSQTSAGTKHYDYSSPTFSDLGLELKPYLSPNSPGSLSSTTNERSAQRLVEQANKLGLSVEIPGSQEAGIVLLNYVAHFINRGKVVVCPTSGHLPYQGMVYGNVGYDSDFLEFWLHLCNRKDFAQLYLEGDVYCFGQFSKESFEVGECVYCNLQVPIPLGMHHYQGGCHLCDKQPTHKVVNLLAVGTPPDNLFLLQKLFALRGFKANFVAHPRHITTDLLNTEIDLVLLYDEVTVSIAQLWLKSLRRYGQLQGIPIVALSRKAGQGNHSESGILEESLQQDMRSESLVTSLHYLAHQSSRKQSLLYWLPH